MNEVLFLPIFVSTWISKFQSSGCDSVEHEPLIHHDYYRIDSSEASNEGEHLKGEPILSAEIKDELSEHLAEMFAGNLAEVFGTNPHIRQPNTYPDFGRRFVPQYLYKEVLSQLSEEPLNEDNMTPKLAPPELVLEVAKQSALLDAASPNNPTDEVIRKDILRTGDYWNAVWKEDVDPLQTLRTNKHKKMKSVTTKIMPESELYELVLNLKKKSPKLLYVINKKKH